MSTTISFDNARGFWKSRYSFISNAFASLNKTFLSSPATFTDKNPVYTHEEGDGNNMFYGGDAMGSAITVAFNKNVSSNKVYKSISIEGTSNISGINTFVVNNSSDTTQAKRTIISKLKEKGGIMYGGIGQELSIGNNTFNAVGLVLSASTPNTSFGFTDTTTEGYISMSLQMISNTAPSSSTAKYFLKNISNETMVMLNGSLISTDILYEDIISNLSSTTPAEVSMHSGSNLILKITFDSGSNFYSSVASLVNELSSGEYILYELSQGAINGDNPKGQYAEAVLAFDSSNFEIFAINVESESTDYDHGGAVK